MGDNNQTIDMMTQAAKDEASSILKQDKKEPKKHKPKVEVPKAKWQQDLQKIKDSGTLKKDKHKSSKPMAKKEGIRIIDGTSAKPKVSAKPKEEPKTKESKKK